MSTFSTLSEKIFEAKYTGRDPAELATLVGVNSTLTAAELNILDGVTATAAQINAAAVPASGVIIIPDATPYTVLAADSGKTHIISEQTSTITINLPAAAALGLDYEFIMGGVAVEAQNWIFVATTAAFINGGVAFVDRDAGAGADEAHDGLYGNGTSHLTFTVVTPAAGTYIRFVGNGTEWVLNGYVNSATVPTMA
jgi:hypothetical protein